LDYALASNLNVFGSFLYATRVSHGYGWGFIKPAGVPGAITGAINFTPTGTFATPSPAIPDNSLGWEVDAGLNWNLLENWMLDVTAGYWQPGKWFNYACISKAVPGWDVPTAANNFGVSPDRSIGPVVAFVTRLTVGF
jgi:opacity protein-like surface antigen